MRASIPFAIADTSQTGEARRSALALAARLGFSETERGKVAIVVTELANNLLQHAKSGVLLLQAIEQPHKAGIEILSLDKGAGIHNIDECLQDGFSTAGTPGNGLGAINRLSSRFDVYSTPGAGTAILSHLWAAPGPIAPSPIEVGVVCLPKAGEDVSGDAWAVVLTPERAVFLVADGLGHGPLAAIASNEAVRVFQEQAHQNPQAIIHAAHPVLRSTRGAAIAIAAIDFDAAALQFAGVGNIAAKVQAIAGNQNLVSYNGTVGGEIHKLQEFRYAWPADGLLIMHSDGLATQWYLDRYPGLSHKHPSLIAGVLYRDFTRGRDDVTVLVARENRS